MKRVAATGDRQVLEIANKFLEKNNDPASLIAVLRAPPNAARPLPASLTDSRAPRSCASTPSRSAALRTLWRSHPASRGAHR
jgi:hypothetical protein